MKQKISKTLIAITALSIATAATGFAHNNPKSRSASGIDAYSIRTATIQPDGSLWSKAIEKSEKVDCAKATWPIIPASCFKNKKPVRMVSLEG